jgi:rhamnopyranosyl-N-acetylglucosaminyl-diphospho-decaprenol beta-1,3/1,4-galactofuranosyltransferase
MSPAVCAIVVTYNRRELLRECLEALLNQTAPVARILLIDNQSTDGTPDMVRDEFLPRAPQLELHTLPKNVGGAGGFHAGMARATQGDGCDWLWLMDDDTTALEQLLRAWERFPEGEKPELLASRSLWIDGTIHPMNAPQIRLEAPAAFLAAEHATLAIRAATFVSVLIRSRCVEKYGLPMADYFVWTDDVEYTARILRDDLGVLVPASTVIHKTATCYGPVEGSAARFYYFVRNNLWMLLYSDGWRRSERAKLALSLCRRTTAFMRTTREKRSGLAAIANGIGDALRKRPTR